MKLSIPFTLLLLPSLGSAVKCGQWYSSNCVCDSDVRYCEDGQNGASDDILDQHPLWSHLQGFYKFTAYDFAFGLYPSQGAAAQNFPYYGYLNHTIIGSRDYQHRYQISPPANASDPAACTGFYGPFIAGIPDYTCGVTGLATFFEGFASSSYERDGSLTTTPALTLPGPDAYQITKEDNADYKLIPVDENTLQGSVKSDTFFVTETFVFTNSDRTTANSVQDVYQFFQNQSILVQSTRLQLQKLPDAKNFTESIAADYERFNVPNSLKQQLPMNTVCLNDICPTEEDFCQIDPKCSESIYQEPSVTIKAGPIVAIVCAVFAVLIALLFYLHRRSLNKQKDALKNTFAKHVIDTLGIGKGASAEFFTMDALTKEFNAIDSGTDEGGDGKISKAELKAFMTSGKIGEVSDSEFDTLFGIIDADGNGDIDFIEFTGFMGDIKNNIESLQDDTFKDNKA